MPEQYPSIEPFDAGLLDVGDGHRVYWERCGTLGATPAVFVHGGPGSGCSVNHRRFFDPARYDVVLFDQRGAGRSRPLAHELDVNLATNTTHHLIADMEKIRELCGFERWCVVGVSWGSTLALAYALYHRDRVKALLAVLVTTGSRDEIEWITEGVGRLFPAEWERFRDAVPESHRHLRLVDAYAQLVLDPDPAIHEVAAREWCRWEDAHVSLAPGHQPNPRYEKPEFRLRFSRLVTHYWHQDCFLGEREILRRASELNGVPGILINGRYDVSGSPVVAWELAKSWTTGRLVVVGDAGHGGGDGLRDAIIDSLNDVASH